VDQEGNRGQLDQPVSETPDDATRIREQIEHTRANLSGTIEELQDRLRPEKLVSQASDAVKETARQKVRTMVNTASETAGRVAEQARSSASSVTEHMQHNPIPTALALGGLAWLMTRSGRRRYSGYDDGSAMAGLVPAVAAGAVGYYLLSQQMVGADRSFEDEGAYGTGYGYETSESGGTAEKAAALTNSIGERVRNLGETASARVRSIGHTADEYRHRARAAVGSYAGQAKEQARQLSDVARVRVEETTTRLMERSEVLGANADRWMQENPLAVGVAVFALGAIAGLSMPVTEAEHRTLGPARERLMHEASRVMENAIK
jgi:ElaB/YqjD/DUF883 family membrane-anchored ribosome-binding protein